MNARQAIFAALVGSILLAGCGGGDAHVQVQGTSTVTTGMEMQDLQRALNEGAISQQEFDEVKNKLLRRSR